MSSFATTEQGQKELCGAKGAADMQATKETMTTEGKGVHDDTITPHHKSDPAVAPPEVTPRRPREALRPSTDMHTECQAADALCISNFTRHIPPGVIHAIMLALLVLVAANTELLCDKVLSWTSHILDMNCNIDMAVMLIMALYASSLCGPVIMSWTAERLLAPYLRRRPQTKLPTSSKPEAKTPTTTTTSSHKSHKKDKKKKKSNKSKGKRASKSKVNSNTTKTTIIRAPQSSCDAPAAVGVEATITVTTQQAVRRRRGGMMMRVMSSTCAGWLLFIMGFMSTSASIVLPALVTTYMQVSPLPSMVIMCFAVTIWMKLISYHHTRADLRTKMMIPTTTTCQATTQQQAPLPQDTAVPTTMVYFMIAPTLVYQAYYPRSGPVRWTWLVTRVTELIGLLTVLCLVCQHGVVPILPHAIVAYDQMNLVALVQHLLEIALPCTVCWLLGFYCLFHLWLNILAELLCFGDRQFYKAWWNCATVGEFWKLWNLPVHNWMLRHVFVPVCKMGVSKTMAILLAFVLSAVMHEVVCAVPLGCLKPWAFLGMMAQVPLAHVTDYLHKRYKRDDIGNYIFWVSFCILGQPSSVILYSHEYSTTNMMNNNTKAA